jgi:hypothetical protein
MRERPTQRLLNGAPAGRALDETAAAQLTQIVVARQRGLLPNAGLARDGHGDGGPAVTSGRVGIAMLGHIPTRPARSGTASLDGVIRHSARERSSGGQKCMDSTWR